MICSATSNRRHTVLMPVVPTFGKLQRFGSITIYQQTQQTM